MRTPSLPSRPPALVAKYYAYRATATFGFFWPIFTVFLLSRDLSYTQIALLGSLSAAVSVLGELPTGYVGDRVGRRNSLLLGALARAVSVYALAFAESFPAFVALYVVWAVGGAFTSGAGDAWLYDVLAERLDASAFTRVRGRGGAVNMTVSAVTMLAAGALYAADPRLPFLVGGTVNAAGVPVLLAMPRVDDTRDRERNGDGAGDGERNGDGTGEGDGHLGVGDAARIVRTQLLRPPVRSVVAGVALFFGVVGAVDTYIQPIAVDAVGLSELALGPLYAGFSAVAAVASYHADRLERALGTAGVLAGVPVVVSASLVVPAAVAPTLAVPAFVALKGAREVVAPVASGYVNANVDSVGRTTVLSAAAMCYGTVRLVLKPVAGMVADAFGPLATVAGLGAVLAAGVLVVRGAVALTDADDVDAARA
ncbi:MFS transporter [Halorubellus sp. PRR65]|uniref:MFS transporter n=1 Tax=Halorubellus sp. PRR65 TaxID=3098148 RepID=UPI002B263878|nr:MFS transporter [Halorubellus sp. PRR65]